MISLEAKKNLPHHLCVHRTYVVFSGVNKTKMLSLLCVRFIYMLGKDTWVERWPLSAECSSDPALQDKCRTLHDTAQELSLNGCRL